MKFRYSKWKHIVSRVSKKKRFSVALCEGQIRYSPSFVSAYLKSS